MKPCTNPNCQQINPQSLEQFHKAKKNTYQSWCKSCKHLLQLKTTENFLPIKKINSANRKLKSLEKVMFELNSVHRGMVTMVVESFINHGTIATFKDAEYGEWLSTPNNVLRGKSHPKRKQEKISQSMMKNHGVKYYTQSPNMRHKSKQTCL